jgi:iron(III) transport system substrate-binding protein
MSRFKLALLAAPALCAALTLAACGGAGPDALTIYSGQHEQTTAMLVSRFEHATGIKVQVRTGDEQALGNQVLQEGSSSPADIFYSENTPVLESLSKHGLLAPVDPSTLASVPSRYSSAQGRWVGVSGRFSALVYNRAGLGGLTPPGSILELAQPRWKGKLAFAPTETDFQPLVTSVVKLHGRAAAEQWLKGLQANGAVYPDNETVVTQVNNGQSAIAPLNTYYWYRLRDELGTGGMHSAIAYVAPGDAGAVLNVSGAAILASSSHRSAAQRFLAFLVSAEGQEAIAHSHSYEYPLRPGVAAAPGLLPLSQVHPAPLTPAELGDGGATLALEQELGLL